MRHEPLHCVGSRYVTKEWAKLFLTNWNRAVSVWNNGELLYG